MERIKLRFPWEVPRLETEEELRDFWDTHDITEEYINYSLNSEHIYVPSGIYQVHYIIKNIPALNLWDKSGILISSSYEDHVEESLLKLKDSLVKFTSLHPDKIKNDRQVCIDFQTKKVKSNPKSK
jgi:hypothetical protein